MKPTCDHVRVQTAFCPDCGAPVMATVGIVSLAIKAFDAYDKLMGDDCDWGRLSNSARVAWIAATEAATEELREVLGESAGVIRSRDLAKYNRAMANSEPMK